MMTHTYEVDVDVSIGQIVPPATAAETAVRERGAAYFGHDRFTIEWIEVTERAVRNDGVAVRFRARARLAAVDDG